MASSQLAITNLALTLIGEVPIQSIAEPSLKAEVCARMYEGAIRTALGRTNWRFADKKADLSQLVLGPLNEWQYAYQIPTDSCRVNRVHPDTGYEIYGDQIYSNQPSLSIDYNARTVGLETLMPPHFERYAAHELTTLIAYTLTSDDGKVKLAEQWRSDFLATAATTDAQQRPSRRILHSPFVDARRGGHGR